MKVFHCGHCDQLVFFENSACMSCGRTLAYLPDRTEMGTLEPATGHQWRLLSAGKGGQAYRLCLNYSRENVCNWAVAVDDPNPYCRSCRLNRVIPNLSRSGTRQAWARLEAAKRRLIYSLLCLDLPVSGKAEDPQRGLAFDFLADPDPGTPGAVAVPTGHLNGVITINIAEADDAEREKRRLQMHEPYRTLLGHFRHEIGHYYWDRLIGGTARIDQFRRLFGDERQDYGQLLHRHHQQGAPADWAKSFVSAYASAHPWEDWAETWAHYLHITDTLETALQCGLSLQPRRSNEPEWKLEVADVGQRALSFDLIVQRWFPLTYVLNNLNRGMGLPDAYPFVLPTPVLNKLRFVHEVVRGPEPSAPR
ncbi:MAG: putative zinc-binding peptidase [Isosphaeraceae bacterium]|nr:putative zinc-binding peptidase [Isosphaeraceae bacterium]